MIIKSPSRTVSARHEAVSGHERTLSAMASQNDEGFRARAAQSESTDLAGLGGAEALQSFEQLRAWRQGCKTPGLPGRVPEV